MIITLEKNNINKIKTLLECLGSDYKSVPLLIYKKASEFNVGNSVCYAEIKVAKEDASEIFSSNILLDDIKDLKLNEELMVRLPINKTILNILFDTFDKLDIDNVSITAKTDKKELTMSLLVLDKIYNYEIQSEDLYHHYRNDNEYIMFKPDVNEIKEFLSLFSTLKISDKDRVNINISTTDKGLLVTAKDKMNSSFKYVFTTNDLFNEDVEIDSEFGYSFITMLYKISKIKDIDNIRMLISNILISTNCWNDTLVINYGVPSK